MTLPSPKRGGDKLYSLSFRPQEMAVFGDDISFRMRLGTVTDTPDEPATAHYRMIVLEADAKVPDHARESVGAETIQVLKIGWELELLTDEPALADQVPQLDGEVEYLLKRIADTVNDLARRAGLEAPMAPALINELLHSEEESSP